MKKASTGSPVQIVLPEFVGLTQIETLCESYFSVSTSAGAHFNLENVQWLGHFPAALLYGWVALLRASGKDVKLTLPSPLRQTQQFTKAALRCRVVERCQQLGAEVQGAIGTTDAAGVPLTSVASVDAIGTSIESALKKIRDSVQLSGPQAELVTEAFSVVLFELAENAFVHSKSLAAMFLQVSVAKSAATAVSDDPQGLMTRFAPETRYAEIVLGDLGVGLDATLAAPEEFDVAFDLGTPVTKEAKALAYAFEFSATSNVGARAKRIDQILQNPGINPAQVATGLFCVADVARRMQGQIVVRTERETLSIDYSRNALNPTIRTRHATRSNRSKKRSLPGTQYCLRLPIDAFDSASTSSPRSEITQLSQYSVVAAPSLRWHTTSEVDSEAAAIAACIHQVEKRIRSANTGEGLLVIPPAVSELSSRGRAVFAAALAQVSPCLIVYLDSLNPTTVKDGEQSDTPGILSSRLLQNTFYAEYQPPGAKKFSFRPEVFAEITSKAIDELLIQVRAALSSPDIRRQDGAFFLGSYYTTLFFDAAEAVKNSRLVYLMACCFVWKLRRIGAEREVELPEVVLSLSERMNPLAKEIADELSNQAGSEVVYVGCPADISANWVNSRLFTAKRRRIAVLADVICTGHTLGALVSTAAKTFDVQICCLVDGRQGGAGHSGPIVLEGGVSVPVHALLRDLIQTHREPINSKDATSDERSERIYRIDNVTNTPKLVVFNKDPEISLTDLANEGLSQSGALVAGHVEHDHRHFNYFLDLRRLFAHYYPRLKEWIENEAHAFEEAHLPSLDEWQLRLLSASGESVLPDVLWSELKVKKGSFRSVPAKQLDLVEQPSVGHDRHWILVVPTMETGWNSRRLVEWAVRQRPKSVLVLVLLSRMDPRDFAFYTDVTTFSHVKIRYRLFLDSHALNAVGSDRACEVCQAVARFEFLAQQAHAAPDTGYLGDALLRKADRLRVKKFDQHSQEGTGATEGDLSRASLRILVADQLQSLKGDVQVPNVYPGQDGGWRMTLELMLKLISSEQPYAKAPLHPFLAASESLLHALEEECIGLLDDAAPPVQISSYVSAIAQLLPEYFLQEAPTLIQRFASLPRDVEEIIVAAVTLSKWSDDFSQSIDALGGDEQFQSVVRLGIEARTFVSRLQSDRHLDDVEEFVNACCLLHAEIMRSRELPLLRLDSLLEALQNAHVNDVKRMLDERIRAWNSGAARLLIRLSASERWQQLVQEHPVAPHVDALRRSVSFLDAHSKSILTADSQILRGRIKDDAAAFYEALKTVGAFLDSLIACPVNLPSIAALEGDLVSRSGTRIRVQKEIDYGAIQDSFMAFNALDSVCGQLLDNWRKHAHSATAEAWLLMRRSGRRVDITFRDSIPGAFDRSSLGGLRLLQNYASTYPAEINYESNKEWKQVTISIVHLNPNVRKADDDQNSRY